jgi:ferric-dicitrate binding protein FerR (iron transport regulator)
VIAVSHRALKSALRKLLVRRVVPLEGGTAIPETRMVTDDGGRLTVVQMTRAKVDAHDTWRNNMLIFDQTPLNDIVEEFNRYNQRKLEIGDPSIGAVRIGGRYSTRDVDGFLRHLGSVIKIRVTETSRESGGIAFHIQSDGTKPGGKDPRDNP